MTIFWEETQNNYITGGIMNDPTIVLTPECTIVYPELFEPTKFGNESEPKYRATFLIDLDNDIKPIREACRYAAYKKFGTGVNLKNLRYPIRDGNKKAIDENGKPDPTNFYYNRIYIAAKSKYKIPIVDIYNNEIMDENEIYGGCIVRAYLNFFGYSYMGDGISAGLRAVCKISDGEPIGSGKINTAEAFKDFIKEKPSFMDGPPMNSREYNEGPGQRNDDPLRDSNPWGDNEPPQEPDFDPECPF